MKYGDNLFIIGMTWMLCWVIIIPNIFGFEMNELFLELGIGGYVVVFIVYAIQTRKEDKQKGDIEE